jgi:uncharacterized membrane protein YbhN (UPF0104 family)
MAWTVWARRAVLVVLVGLAGWALIGHRQELGDALGQVAPWSVLLAFVPALLAAGVSLVLWRTMMAEFGVRLPYAGAAHIFYVSQLGKYVPGSAWSIVMQVDLGRRYDIPRRAGVAVGVLVIAVATTTGLALGALLLPFGVSAGLTRYWWVLLVLPVLIIGLHPRVLGAALQFVLRLTRREPLRQTPSWRGLGRLVGLQSLVWTALGLQVWVLLLGLGASPGRAFVVAIGGYALAHSLGLLAIGLPAGVGVREAVLTLALSTVVPPATALVVALVARAVLTVVDLGLAATQSRPRRAPTPPAPTPPAPAANSPVG